MDTSLQCQYKEKAVFPSFAQPNYYSLESLAVHKRRTFAVRASWSNQSIGSLWLVPINKSAGAAAAMESLKPWNASHMHKRHCAVCRPCNRDLPNYAQVFNDRHSLTSMGGNGRVFLAMNVSKLSILNLIVAQFASMASKALYILP